MGEAFITARGGGAGLNFRIVGGTTQPTSASENTIWVNTSTSITSWIFSATQPTSPASGMVWFNISTSSTAPINAIKKNGLWVYPAACKQYVNGSWVSKDAKTYQNGVWVSWKVYLFTAGAYGNIVSGMTTYAKMWVSGVGQTEGTRTVTISNNQLYIRNSSEYDTGMAVFKETIDVTPFKTLSVTGKVDDTNANNICVWSSIGTYVTSNVLANKTMSTSKSTVNIDISSITGKVYIGFSFLNIATTTNYYIDEVVLS